MKDTYHTLEAPSEGLYKEKGSKFIAFAYPVAEEDSIKTHLDELRKSHHSARHHCYAWKLGMDDNNFRANDDGEPGNSAGKPILGQIIKHELTNVLIVVVRYFGGTKLGVGGLMNAYKTAAAAAIDNGEIIQKQLCSHYLLKFSYDEMNAVMTLIKELNLPNYDQQFNLDCKLKVIIPLSESEMLEQRLDDLKGVKFILLETI